MKTEKITIELDTTKIKDKVFFDCNQNARGKTITSVSYIRSTVSAIVSVHITWNDLSNAPILTCKFISFIDCIDSQNFI